MNMDNQKEYKYCADALSDLRVSNLDVHNNNVNGSDRFSYQFETNVSLKGLPTLVLEEILTKALGDAHYRLSIKLAK